MKRFILVFLVLIIGNLAIAQFGPQYEVAFPAVAVNSLDVADLDGDGDVDVLSGSNDGVGWYENLGNDVFRFKRVISNSITWNVSAIDIDGDGDLDILTCRDSIIGWYKNIGGGVFDSTQNLINDSAYSARQAIGVDLDLDGDIDVMAVSYLDDKIVFHENFGAGVFGAEQIITDSNYTKTDGVNSLFFADVDGDTDLDLLTTSYLDDKVSWFENIGGNIDTVQNIISSLVNGVDYVHSIDINGDGDNDVIVGNFSGKISWFENLGLGLFGAEQIILVSGAQFFTIGDLDNDGDMDIAASYYIADKVRWFENDGVGVFTLNLLTISNNEGPQIIISEDLNADGMDDILFSSLIDKKITWHQSFGGGSFSTANPIADPSFYPQTTHAMDVDNDGDIDILAPYGQLFQIAWYENLGGGIMGNPTLLPGFNDGARSIISADLDGDGDEDLLNTSPVNFQIVWQENLGGAIFGPRQVLNAAPYYSFSITTADMDNDGDIDIVGSSYAPSLVFWFENLGGGVFTTEQIMPGPSTSATCVSTFDLEGDGDLDILIAESISSDRVVYYENLGSGVFSGEQLLPTSIGRPGTVLGADINGDGKDDIVVGTILGFTVAWYENLGGGLFSLDKIITGNGDQIRDIIGEDFDGDGDLDIACTSFTNDKISVFENLGNGSFGTEVIVAQFPLVDGPFDICAADINGDGKLDIVSASQNDQKIAWYGNTGYFPYVSGKLFYDANQNASLDSNETGLGFLNAQIQPSGLVGYSNVSGNYTFTPDTGTSVVSYIVDPLWNLTTDSSSYTAFLSTSNFTIDSLNFGFFPDTIFTVLEPHFTGGFPRCNDTVNYWIDINNKGTSIPSGVIHLELDNLISFVSSAILPDSVSGNSYYWHYDSLFFHTTSSLNLKVMMPTVVNIGDTLISYLNVNELDSFGIPLLQRSDTLNQILVCSYDPNDKSVSPTGVDSVGFINKNQELEYLVRFQNTGNDTAITVRIRDSLDSNLDWNSLVPLAGSHLFQVTLEAGGVIEFKFENIMLPDSGADFLGSQGFIKFRIYPIAGLPPLTPIMNEAEIYFDLNPPVLTNSVLNTIECYTAPIPSISFTFPYLNAGVSGNYSYQWFLNDTLIIGAIADTLVPIVDGTYSVLITDSNSCSKLSDSFPYIALEIVELYQLESKVFPNPYFESTTLLFIKSLEEDYDLLVLNLAGVVVKRINKIPTNILILNKNDTGKGMFFTYLVDRKTGEKIFIEKLIVL